MPAVASPFSADTARHVLKALADPVRLHILEALTNGERCVCDLTSELDLAQSRLSFHLKVLKDAGLLKDRQSGRWVYYQLQPHAIEALQTWLSGLVARSQQTAACCADDDTER